MKSVRFFALIALLASAVPPSTAATLAEKFIREARDKYQRFTRKLYDNSIADGIDIAADISANLINCRDSLSTTLSKVCGNNVDSDYKSYCTTIEGIKNSADHGMKMIDEIVANKNSLTANAFDSYFDEIFNTLKSNVEKLIKEKVTNKKQTGCYFMKYQKGMSKFDQRLMSLVRQYLQQYLIAGQAGFFDEIEGFRKQIVDASEACFKTDDVATCLNDFTNSHASLQSDFETLIEEILEFVNQKFTTVGPGKSEVEKLYDEHRPEVELEMGKC